MQGKSILRPMRDFWRRHKRKLYVTLGVIGSGYLLYKLYEGHKRRLSDLEKELADERENDELIKAQMQAHFDNIQRIANSTTLPHAMLYLNSRVTEELDLMHLTERLIKAKDQPDTLTPLEKLELWDKLKILSFTGMVSSLWAMTMLSLYIRVQVNILGRHLYIDTARGLGSSHLLEEADLIDKDDEQKFLASADFLASYGMSAFIQSMQAASTEVLKGKQLKDSFNTTVLHEVIMQILDKFMRNGSPPQWVDHLMPVDTRFYKIAASSHTDNVEPTDFTKFDQLMVETRAVLSSTEFGRIAEISLKTVVDMLMEDIRVQLEGNSSGMPLARLLPRVAQMGQPLLEEPSRNKFVQVIRSIQEVEVFFTLLYANIPTS